MKNGIAIFRERAGINKAELARRVGTTRQQMGRLEADERELTVDWAEKIAPHLGCSAQDLLFPEMARIDLASFNNVFEVSRQPQSQPEKPSLALEKDFLARLLPSAAAHNLRLMMVEGYQTNSIVTKGDAVVIDLDDNRPSRPGLYAIDIGGDVQWRYLSPTTSGAIQVHSENPSVPTETVSPAELKIVGRAKLKISTI